VYSLYLITYSRLTTISDDNDEMRAQELVERGQIDEAIAIYQRSAPESARTFYNIGILYADKKGDYDSAIKYYKKALKIQEKVSH
jgi:tetratricopeptide (TPR) repeat protein